MNRRELINKSKEELVDMIESNPDKTEVKYFINRLWDIAVENYPKYYSCDFIAELDDWYKEMEEKKRVISCLECGNNLFNVEEITTRQMRSHYQQNSRGKEHTLDREGGEEAVIDKIRCTNCDADMKAHILETESRTGIELVFNW